MTMDSATEDLVRNAVQAVWSAAADAVAASDLSAMKQRLNECWFAVHKAQETINRADAETRRAALAKLETARTFA